jgi:hypothetical protein
MPSAVTAAVKSTADKAVAAQQKCAVISAGHR